VLPSTFEDITSVTFTASGFGDCSVIFDNITVLLP
jgi:hypothetical protein